MNKSQYVHFAATVLSLVGAALPFGAVYIVAEEETTVSSALNETASFFDLTVFQSGNIGPLIAGVLIGMMCATALLTLFIGEKRRVQIVRLTVSVLALMATVLPLAQFGWEGFTTTAQAVVYLLAYCIVYDVMQLNGCRFRYFENENTTQESAS